MTGPVATMRNILRREQTVHDGPPAVDPPEERARRLAEHERRIHNHPCPCGSGHRYADCCIGRANQEHLELKRRRELARQGMASCECCGRDFRPRRDLTCPHCGYDNGPGRLPRTEKMMRHVETKRKHLGWNEGTDDGWAYPDTEDDDE